MGEIMLSLARSGFKRGVSPLSKPAWADWVWADWAWADWAWTDWVWADCELTECRSVRRQCVDSFNGRLEMLISFGWKLKCNHENKTHVCLFIFVMRRFSPQLRLILNRVQIQAVCMNRSPGSQILLETKRVSLTRSSTPGEMNSSYSFFSQRCRFRTIFFMDN